MDIPALCYLRKVSLSGFIHVYFLGKFQTTGGKGLRRHHGDVDLHIVLASRRYRALRFGFVSLLRRRRRREGHRQERSLVHFCGHAVQLLRACSVHRVQCHVRAWRRVSRGQRGHGRDAGKVFGICPAVRLRAYRPNQRRVGRPLSCRTDRRNRKTFRTSAGGFSDQ